MSQGDWVTLSCQASVWKMPVFSINLPPCGRQSLFLETECLLGARGLVAASSYTGYEEAAWRLGLQRECGYIYSVTLAHCGMSPPGTWMFEHYLGWVRWN